jgi:hypothetical protein
VQIESRESPSKTEQESIETSHNDDAGKDGEGLISHFNVSLIAFFAAFF